MLKGTEKDFFFFLFHYNEHEMSSSQQTLLLLSCSRVHRLYCSLFMSLRKVSIL